MAEAEAATAAAARAAATAAAEAEAEAEAEADAEGEAEESYGSAGEDGQQRPGQEDEEALRAEECERGSPARLHSRCLMPASAPVQRG